MLNGCLKQTKANTKSGKCYKFDLFKILSLLDEV